MLKSDGTLFFEKNYFVQNKVNGLFLVQKPTLLNFSLNCLLDFSEIIPDERNQKIG